MEEKLNTKNFFKTSVVYGKRSMLLLSIDPEMTDYGEDFINYLAKNVEQNPKTRVIAKKLAKELLQISMALGFLDTEIIIPSDGSMMVFNQNLKDQPSFSINELDTLDKRSLFLRSQQRSITLNGFFFIFSYFWFRNYELFYALYEQDLPYGIIRADSMFAFFKTEELTLESYLLYIENNLKERMTIFGLEKYIKGINGSSHLIIDDELKRNVFKISGSIDLPIGYVETSVGKRNFYLSIRPGYSESSLGIDFVITAENTNSSLYCISVVLTEQNGKLCPTITRFQINPMQLNNQLQYVDEFLPHKEMPGFKKVSEYIGNLITHLGGDEKEDMFDLLLACIILYYKARGFEYIYGLSYEDCFWIKYHNPGMKEQNIKRTYYPMYDERLLRTGFCPTHKNTPYKLNLNCTEYALTSLAKPIIWKTTFKKSGKTEIPIIEHAKPMSKNSLSKMIGFFEEAFKMNISLSSEKFFAIFEMTDTLKNICDCETLEKERQFCELSKIN